MKKKISNKHFFPNKVQELAESSLKDRREPVAASPRRYPWAEEEEEENWPK